jgi:tetratricopeptide (TPR) repeat protein
MKELSNHVDEEIKRLCAIGDKHAEARAYSEAIPNYWAAWDLLPEPKTEWDAATWILVAIGDANYLGGDFVAGRDNFSNAMRCPDAIGKPFIHFRLGQCLFEVGELERSADELMRAYMGAGKSIFDQHDPKYARFLASRAEGTDLDGPAKRWWQFWKK